MPEEILQIFSNKLKYYLDINGYTQKDLANKAKVSEPTASDWCSGKKMPRMGRDSNPRK